MIKYATAKRSGPTDTVFKIDTDDPILIRDKSPRRVMAEWLNQNPTLYVINLYEVVHSAIPKELVCWYEVTNGKIEQTQESK